MEVIHTVAQLREAIRTRKADKGGNAGSEYAGNAKSGIAGNAKNGNAKGDTVGLVPTMGFLHDGHASLLKRARQENGTVVLSIFVNPTQFGPNEDFSRYPRDPERDLEVARNAGIDFVFMPEVEEMYPRKPLTTVSVKDITGKLCGASRPVHFDGVATVVSKLFHIVEPDNAYFGMKDAQQVAVIRTMVDDLNLPVNIVPCPIIRDEDGLALSSRNIYLQPEERKQALVLSQALFQADRWLEEVEGSPLRLKERIIDYIRTAPLADIDYVEVLSYPTLADPCEWGNPGMTDQEMIIALAVRFGGTRLIDNRLLPIPNNRINDEICLRRKEACSVQ
jgi:pantoate--beta-alanine ligase